MKHATRWTGLTLALLAAPFAADVHACSCAPLPTVQSEVDLSTSVFRGKVLQSAAPAQGIGSEVEYTFRVDEVWKGSADTLQVVAAFADGFLCGRTYEVGTEYLVYTSGTSDSSCSRTKVLSEAQADLTALGDGVLPQPASSELAIRHARFDGAWYDPARPGEGVVLDVLEDGRVALYWYTYSPAATGEQVWLVGVGDSGDNHVFFPEVFQTRGGRFGFGFLSSGEPASEEAWGVVSMEFLPDGTANLFWTPEAEGFQLGRATLQRIGRPPAQRIDFAE